MNNYTHTEQVGIVAYVVLSHMNNYTHRAGWHSSICGTVTHEQLHTGGYSAYVVLSHMNNYTHTEQVGIVAYVTSHMNNYTHTEQLA